MTRMTDKISSASSNRLVFELGRLTELMQSLREAIHRQEIQVWSMVKDGGGVVEAGDGGGEIEAYRADTRPSAESQQLYTMSDDQLGKHLHRTDSNDSQVSHWSWSLETINSSVGELKQVLRSQDRQVAELIAELESLRDQVKKKDKEIKKQKFLLKAEREMFEQYKKDTCNEVKQKKSEANTAIKTSEKPKKPVEIEMMKSELAHYKQMYGETQHTVQRLEKQVKSLREERQHLRAKMVEQEIKSNQFILETAHRFDKCKNEYQLAMSRLMENVPFSSTESVVCKIVDRSARLAYDNCMLKLELEKTKAKLEEYSKVKKTRSLTTRLTSLNTISEESNLKRQPIEISAPAHPIGTTEQKNNVESFKTTVDRKFAVHTSTKIIEHVFDNRWQDSLNKNLSLKSDEEFEVVRSESEPNLNLKNGKKVKPR